MARCSFSASTADQISMRSIKHNEEGQLYAFDMLAGEDDDMRQLPLSMGKANLAGCRPSNGRHLQLVRPWTGWPPGLLEALQHLATTRVRRNVKPQGSVRSVTACFLGEERPNRRLTMSKIAFLVAAAVVDDVLITTAVTGPHASRSRRCLSSASGDGRAPAPSADWLPPWVAKRPDHNRGRRQLVIGSHK